MKKQLLTILICSTMCLAANSQTNTFPSSGNVGIGTLNPVVPLEIAGVLQTTNYNSGSPAYWDNMKLWSDGESSHINSEGDENGMFIKSLTGNKILLMSKVGIGINTPIEQFQLKGNMLLKDNSQNSIIFSRDDFSYNYQNSIYGRINLENQGLKFNSVRWTGTGTTHHSIQFGQEYVPSISQYAFVIKSNIKNDNSNSESIRMLIDLNGNVGIGTVNPNYKLDVLGTIRSREVKVDMNGADFVFEQDYKLMPLNELEKYLQKEKHLPEIATAKEMETNGTDLGALNSKLLQKVEELTLYVIQLNKEIKELKANPTK